MGGGPEPAALWRTGLVGWRRPQDHPAAPDGLALPADINECVTDLHTCSRREHCVNTVGSFHCYKALTCEPGYRLQDGECTGEEGWLQAPPRPSPTAHLRPGPAPSRLRPHPVHCPPFRLHQEEDEEVQSGPLSCSAPRKSGWGLGSGGGRWAAGRHHAAGEPSERAVRVEPRQS